jgi:hypothetical protein
LGAYLGGPVGAQVGGGLGQLGAQLVAGSGQPASAAPSRSYMAPPGPRAPGGPGAPVAQLMSLIQNPAFLQSLLGQIVGPAGRQGVTVGSPAKEIPFAAIMNTLSSLANASAAQAPRTTEDVEASAYLRDERGNFVCDPADPDGRAQRVLELLREASTTEPIRWAQPDPVTEWIQQAGLVR